MIDHTFSAPEMRHINVDASHFAVRFLVPVLSVGVAVGFHWLSLAAFGGALEEQGLSGCLLVPLDFIVFFVAVYVLERLLKQALPSRRSAFLSRDALVLQDARKHPPERVEIAWGKIVNVQAWRFAVKRRSRVPKGWFCVALHLLQDEESIILYTFMPEDEAESMPGYENFVRLRPRSETTNNPDIASGAQQRRLLKLEDQRWNDGAEIERADFHAVLATVAQVVPDWA